MKLKITVLPGDGIGPEVTREAVRVLRAVASSYEHEFEFDERPVGGAAIKESGSPLPAATLDACLSGDAVLLGAVGAPEFDALTPDKRPEAGLLALRRALGAYANLRPAVLHDAIADASPLRAEVVEGTDILIVRELLGGLYFGEPRGTSNEARLARRLQHHALLGGRGRARGARRLRRGARALGAGSRRSIRRTCSKRRSSGARSSRASRSTTLRSRSSISTLTPARCTS